MENKSPPDPLPPQPGFWSDVFAFARQSKKWWLIPVIAVLVIVGLLAIFMASTAGQSFLYTFF